MILLPIVRHGIKLAALLKAMTNELDIVLSREMVWELTVGTNENAY